MKNRKENNKRPLVIVFLLLVVFGIVYGGITFLKNKPEAPLRQEDSDYRPGEKTTIIYYTPDYTENIYKDPEFLDKISSYFLKYTDGGVSYYLTEGDFQRYDDYVNFFQYYFNIIRDGDAALYNKAFADEYYQNGHAEKESFTMQKIYDIEIERLYVSVNLDEDDYRNVLERGIEPVPYSVKYKIMENNGTFRLGVGSDIHQEQIYLMGVFGGEVKILDILTPNIIYKYR